MVYPKLRNALEIHCLFPHGFKHLVRTLAVANRNQLLVYKLIVYPEPEIGRYTVRSCES